MGAVAAVLAACARWIISGGYAPRGCVCALQARARRAIHRLPAAAIGVPRARSPGSLGGWACGLPSTFLAAGVYPAGCVDVTERFASGSTCCARCRAKSGTPGPLSGLLDGSPSRRRRCKGDGEELWVSCREHVGVPQVLAPPFPAVSLTQLGVRHLIPHLVHSCYKAVFLGSMH